MSFRCVVLGALLGCMLAPGTVLVKCALCARNAAAAGEAAGGLGSLLVAALVLLIPTLVIFTGISTLLWKQRWKHR